MDDFYAIILNDELYNWDGKLIRNEDDYNCFYHGFDGSVVLNRTTYWAVWDKAANDGYVMQFEGQP